MADLFGSEYQNTRLVGGFACRVSNDEINDWTEHIRGYSDYRDFQKRDDEMRMLQRAPLDKGPLQKARLEELDRVREHLVRIEAKLYAIGNEWFTRLTVQREIDSVQQEAARKLEAESQRKKEQEQMDIMRKKREDAVAAAKK